jgi:hypothetical protein
MVEAVYPARSVIVIMVRPFLQLVPTTCSSG